MTLTSGPKVFYVEHNAGHGGSPTSLGGMAASLGVDYQPVVLCFRLSRFASQYRQAGIDVRELPSRVFEDGRLYRLIDRLPPFRGRQLAANFLKFFSHTVLMIAVFYRRFRRERPAIVHVNNSLRLNRAEIIAAFLSQTPCVCHVRHIHRCSPIDRMVAKLPVRLVAVSRAVKDNYVRQGVAEEKIVVALNAVDLRVFSPLEGALRADLRKELGLDQGHVYLLAAGRLIPWKGYEIFLRAFAGVVADFPSARALIVGSGSDTGRLKQLAADLSIQERVRFVEHTHSIQDYLRAADIVVHPSSNPDPFPRIVIEAMACGRPVVATNTGGIPEAVVDGETGFLVPPKSVAILQQRLTELVQSPQARSKMGEFARKLAEQEYDDSQYSLRIMKLYDDILRGSSTCSAP